MIIPPMISPPVSPARPAVSPAPTEPRFGGKDSYKIHKNQPVIQVPASEERKFCARLDQLAAKIKAGEYTVIPASGRYKGFFKGFHIDAWGDGSKILINGRLIIKPKKSEGNIRQVILARTKGPRKSKILTVEIHQNAGPTLKYTQKDSIFSIDPVARFIAVVCEQIAKVQNSEQDFRSGMLDNLEF